MPPCRKVCTSKGHYAAVLLDTKGPEIRTAMLRDGKNIQLEKGQLIILEAVGSRYSEFEGYSDEKETRIGLSYSALCQSVKPGSRILLADGSISIDILRKLSETELEGRVCNTAKLGQRKNCSLPGVKVDLPVLNEKDIDDLQNWGCVHSVDFVAASFVQSCEDVRFIRKTLDDAGGHAIQIIAKIENMAGLENFDGAPLPIFLRRLLYLVTHVEGLGLSKRPSYRMVSAHAQELWCDSNACRGAHACTTQHYPRGMWR